MTLRYFACLPIFTLLGALSLGAQTGKSPDEQLLDLASQNGTTETIEGKPAPVGALVKSLLSGGAHAGAVDLATGNTPLILAARNGNIVLVNLFLSAGASVEPRNRQGASALTNAFLSANEALIRLLLAKGARVDPVDGGYLDSSTADSPAVIAIRHKWTDLLPALVTPPANVNRADSFGQTPLVEAVLDADVETVAYLISLRADPNLTTHAGRTALHDATLRGSLPMIAELLKDGANPNTKDVFGKNALQLATALNASRFQDKSLIIEALTAAGAVAEAPVLPQGRPSAPTVVYKSDPEYSEEARLQKFSGSVLISAIIGADGSVLEAHVARKLGMGLDETALTTITRWTFKPAMLGDTPVPFGANIEINFRLL